MRFVYVVISQGNDTYLDLTYLSAKVLRASNPSSRISVYLDAETLGFIQASKHLLQEVVDDFVPCMTPDKSNVFKSRYIKTRLRKWIQGDFIYLDSDTLPIKPLDELAHIPGSFAACLNWNQEEKPNYCEREKAYFEQYALKLPQFYVNGGVLVWRDTPFAHDLSKRYISYWDLAATDEVYYDQPALNAALAQVSHEEVKLLDASYNAQYLANIERSLDAKIWHGYFSNQSSMLHYVQMGVQMIQTTHSLKQSWVEALLSKRLPYVFKDSLDEVVAIEYLPVIQEELNRFYTIDISESVSILRCLKHANQIAVFGLGQSGKLVIAYLEHYFPNKLTMVIDDISEGCYKDKKIVKTEDFLEKYQDEVELVVFGKFQRLNPLLLEHLKIPSCRLKTIE